MSDTFTHGPLVVRTEHVSFKPNRPKEGEVLRTAWRWLIFDGEADTMITNSGWFLDKRKSALNRCVMAGAEHAVKLVKTGKAPSWTTGRHYASEKPDKLTLQRVRRL